MSFPASWARIPVTATYLLRDDSGTPATGRVEFRSAQIVVADGSIIVPVRVTATLDSAGQISLLLPATDDPDIQPNSWTWSVTEVIDRQPRRTYSLAVPHTASSIDLSSISPIPPGSPVYDYLLTSAIGVTVAGQGDLDVLDGRVTALEGAGGGVQLSDATPSALGSASAGVGTEASRDDHVHAMPTAAQVGAEVAGAVSSHEAASDPHPQYTTWSEAGAAAPVQSVAGRTGDITLTTADISGLGTAATANTTDFATAAQGATADTALQPADGLAALDAAAATKLTGIATGATANATDAQLRDRATHTGTQPSTTITGLGDAATRNVGTTAGTVAAGDDPRLSDARTPTAHTHPSTEISDSTATGRAVLTAADAATARTAIDAPSSAQLAGVQATAEAALPKAGGTMTGAIVHSAHSKTARFGVADSPLGFGSIWYNGVQVAYFDNYSFSYLITSYAARFGIGVLGYGNSITLSWTSDGPQNGVLYVGLQGISPVNFSGANTVCMTFGGVGTPSQFRIRGGSGDVLTATEDGAVVVSGPITPQNAFVAALPLAPAEGAIAYASNGRKSGEGAGAGTGVPVYYSAGKWRVYRDDTEVQA